MLSEREIQRDILAYLAARNIFAFAIPNGAHVAGGEQERIRKVTAMKKDGLTPGIPDLCLISKRGQTGFIEVKSETGSVSQKQKFVHERLRERSVPVAVARSVDDAKAALAQWGWA